jgi:hypothetical protein
MCAARAHADVRIPPTNVARAARSDGLAVPAVPQWACVDSRHHGLRLSGSHGLSGFGEDFNAHVGALLGPLVGLPGQARADQPDDGGAVGEDPDDVGAAPDVPVVAASITSCRSSCSSSARTSRAV